MKLYKVSVWRDEVLETPPSYITAANVVGSFGALKKAMEVLAGEGDSSHNISAIAVEEVEGEYFE